MSLSRELTRGSVVTSHKFLRAGRNGGGLAAKALYDDVYGGPPEFVAHSLSPRPEDYSEIFASFYVSRASSIPVLDLTPADETDVFFDVRSSSFDYTEVFGGLDYQDFAVTYEELTKQSSERNGHSPDEAGTPAENESLSDNSDDSTKTQCIFNGDSNLSCDGRTEFSVSYHRTYQSRKEDMSNGMTHVTQISEVPEVTYLVDGTNSPDQDDEIHPLHVNDGGYFNIDLSMGHIEGKQTKKTMPQPPNVVYERQNFENEPQTPKGSDKSNSHLNRSFITISEISLRTEPSQVLPPSRPPPIIGAKKTDHYRLNSDCNHVFPKGISNDSSPPFFDGEVDASLSTAASGESVKGGMKEAQAKVLCAKKMIERKKEGVGTCTKPHLRYDMKDREGSVNTMLDQSDNGDNEIKLSVTDKTKIVIETAEENQVSLQGEKLSMVANKSAKNKLRNCVDDPREWKEGAGFFEVKLDHSRKASELVKNGDIMIHLSGRTIKTEQDIVIEAMEQLGGNDKKIETVSNVHFDKKQMEKVGGEIDWQEGKKMRSQTDTVLNCQTEYERSKGTICNYDLKETEKEHQITQPSVEKKGIRGADKSVNYEVLVEVKDKDNKGEAEQTKLQVNDEKKGKVISEGKDNENKIKESCRVRENELGEIVGIKHLEMKGKLNGSFERAKGEKGLKKIPWQNENGRTEETLDHLVTEKRLQDDLQEGDDVKPPKKTSDILDGKSHEVNGKKDIHERWENILTTHGKHFDERESKKEPEEVGNRESSQMGVKDAVEHVKIEVTIHKVGNECRRMFEDLDRGELVKFNGMHVGTESCQKTKKIKSTERAQVQEEMGLNKIRTEVSEVDDEYKAMKQHCKPDQSIEKVEATEGCHGYKESGDKISECKINNTQLDDARMMHLDIDENVDAVFRGEEDFKHLECQVGTENINESLSVDDNGSLTETNLSNETKYCNREADKDVPMASNLKPFSIGCELKVLKDLIITKEAKSPAVEESGNQVKEVGIRTGHQHYAKVKNTSKLVSFRQYQDSKYDQERGEQGKALNLELNKDKFVPTEVDKERIEKGSKCETNAKPTSERKENNPKLASEVNGGRSMARRDGEKNTERVKREQVLENDRLRKMEEEREREREREKDRMIVDRTTLEGRKTDIEVHAEKAAMERAIADAQQRAMLEARERLEKACAEAREKSLAGKAVLEARVRADCGAVERGNVKARERAFEKAVAEKSVFESRERIERSFSDKLSASSRNTGIRQSSSFSDTPDTRTQSTLESGGSRYTHSSAHGEIREGIKGESAQRCKARLERHKRIAERAANALAEKNMRDLLAKREQLEKSRLGETLDAEVRRWSSGKEGNLRALLSTLQYILWPDSGWQPISLTEVITSAAVKKAYRKATLCVHPDKLQQRGASIQQKYICEKVFDLLKEAWNKFCSEQR